jgi:hypothetical protein
MTITDVSRLDARASAVYERFGGAALGAHLTERLAAKTSLVGVPVYRCVPVSTSADELVDAVRSAAEEFAAGIALRYSGSAEAFSAMSRRGVNSTGHRYTAGMIEEGRFHRATAVELLAGAAAGTKAIILQEMVSSVDWLRQIYCYGESADVTVEVWRPDQSVHLVHSANGVIDHDEIAGARRPPDTREERVVEEIISIGRDMRDALGFDVDVEGFWTGDRFTVLQLRPIPPDMPLDRSLTPAVESLRSRTHYLTRFVWGAFDVTGLVVAQPDRGRNSIGLLTDETRDRGWSGVLRGGAAPVLLDHDRGFRLSHDPTLLPAYGPARDAFRYLSVAGWTLRDDLVGEVVRCVSDGTRGVVSLL